MLPVGKITGTHNTPTHVYYAMQADPPKKGVEKYII
jgi:hypothetical protein